MQARRILGSSHDACTWRFHELLAFYEQASPAEQSQFLIEGLILANLVYLVSG